MRDTLGLLICLLSYCWGFAQDTAIYNIHYSTFLGGSHFEQARDIATDSEGNFYITGGTSSVDFPVTTAAFDTLYNDEGSSTVGNWGPMMVFISKFSKEGELIWSTYLGGPNYDRAYAIEVDQEGYVYVGGRAGKDFPTTPGAFQEDFIQQGPINNLYGHQNGFISKLSPDGANLIWSTYYGSDSFGFFRDIDVDDEGNVYGILNAVKTLPMGIPVDAYDTDLNGGYDMVAVKFSSDGSQVVWATVLGGEDDDKGGPSIRVGPDKSVYVGGSTKSTDWPVTSNAVQVSHGGGDNDMFITRLSPNGDSLIYSTYIGGSDNEFSETHCLEVNHLGQAFLACGTKSNDITTTPNAIKPTKTDGDNFDALLVKLSTDGTTLMGSTYFGGEGVDFAEGLYVDSLGNFYVGGGTKSDDLPTTAGAVQLQRGGEQDGFIIKVSPGFDFLIYCTYWGGAQDDAVRAFHVANDGAIGFSGQTESEGFYVTTDAFQPFHASPLSRADSYFTMLIPEEEPIISSLSNIDVNRQIAVYPNPADGEVYLQSSKLIHQVSLLGQQGQLIFRKNGNGEVLDLSHLQPGIYFLVVQLEGGQMETKRIMVQ